MYPVVTESHTTQGKKSASARFKPRLYGGSREPLVKAERTSLWEKH